MTPIAPTKTTPDQLPRPAWLPRDAWPFALRHHRHHRPDDDVDIHYTDEGPTDETSPVLVFVHAGMWSFIWRDVIADLRADFRCITLDFPGAGLSGGTRHDVDLAAYPAIVNDLLDHLGIEQATLAIHDLGGVVGVVAAADRPDRVEGLVPTNAFAWPPRQAALRTMLGLMGSRPMTALLGTTRLIPRMSRTAMGVGRHFDRTDRQAFFGPYRRRAYGRNFHRAMRSAVNADELFERADAALGAELATVPMLTVFGEKNDPFHFADRWRAYNPGAVAWTVEEGNHFPMCDDPEGYAAQIRRWHRSAVDSST